MNGGISGGYTNGYSKAPQKKRATSTEAREQSRAGTISRWIGLDISAVCTKRSTFLPVHKRTCGVSTNEVIEAYTRNRESSASEFVCPRRRGFGAGKGIEPTRPCGHRILSPARLPVPPARRNSKIPRKPRGLHCIRCIRYGLFLCHCLSLSVMVGDPEIDKKPYKTKNSAVKARKRKSRVPEEGVEPTRGVIPGRF